MSYRDYVAEAFEEVDRLRSRFEFYGLGDRPSSPPASLMRELSEAEAALSAALRPLPPGAPEAVQQLVEEVRAEGVPVGLLRPEALPASIDDAMDAFEAASIDFGAPDPEDPNPARDAARVWARKSELRTAIRAEVDATEQRVRERLHVEGMRAGVERLRAAATDAPRWPSPCPHPEVATMGRERCGFCGEKVPGKTWEDARTPPGTGTSLPTSEDAALDAAAFGVQCGFGRQCGEQSDEGVSCVRPLIHSGVHLGYERDAALTQLDALRAELANARHELERVRVLRLADRTAADKAEKELRDAHYHLGLERAQHLALRGAWSNASADVIRLTAELAAAKRSES